MLFRGVASGTGGSRGDSPAEKDSAACRSPPPDVSAGFGLAGRLRRRAPAGRGFRGSAVASDGDASPTAEVSAGSVGGAGGWETGRGSGRGVSVGAIAGSPCPGSGAPTTASAFFRRLRRRRLAEGDSFFSEGASGGASPPEALAGGAISSGKPTVCSSAGGGDAVPMGDAAVSVSPGFFFLRLLFLFFPGLSGAWAPATVVASAPASPADSSGGSSGTSGISSSASLMRA